MSYAPDQGRSVETAQGADRKLAYLGLGLSVFLVLVTAPFLAARLVMAPDYVVEQKLAHFDPRQKTALSYDRLDSFLHTREAVQEWMPFHDVLDALATGHYILAQMDQFHTPRAQRALEKAMLWQKKALSLSPADPYGWARLASLLWMKEGAGPHAADAFELSYESAPYEPALAVSRLGMCYGLYPYLSDSMRDLLPVFARQAVSYDLFATVRLVKKLGVEEKVRAYLADDPVALERYERMIPKRLK